MLGVVVGDGDAYHARALELVSDLDSLAAIRVHLRDVLLESAVCNAPKFSVHLANALRAIWQRYCANKAPAALAFTPEGQPWFEDEPAPMTLEHPNFDRSEEHTSELQSLMRISYAVFCLKNKNPQSDN